MKEFKREYKWEGEIDIEPCVGFGVAIGNEQPKEKYRTAWWTLIDFAFIFI